jgi:alanine dehydrogenase
MLKYFLERGVWKGLVGSNIGRLTMETLILTRKEIESLLQMEEIIEAVEKAFREKGLGRVQMPPKTYIFYHGYGGDLRCMPSYLEQLDVSAVKVVTVHPENPSKHGLPTVMAVIVLIEPETGFPLAVMDGTWITALRTGAAGTVAAKYLAKKDVRTIGLVGAGVQSKTQLQALLTFYRKLEEVKIYDVVEESKAKLADEFSGSCGGVMRFTPVSSVKEAVAEADLIVTATPSRKPLIMADWVEEGTHFNCIGADAPGKEELDPKILLKSSKIVVDDMAQAIHSGEVNVPISKGIFKEENIYGELGEIVAGLKPGRTSLSEITVFCSTGLAIQDAVTAKLAYDKALIKGVGRKINLTL